MRVKVEGEEEVVDLPTYEREIRVAVAPMRAAGRFFDKNWKWVGTSIVIPLVAHVATTTEAGKAALKRLQEWWLGAG
jgi:hypothetical protein